MRVLLWHVHGSWTTAFVQGKHTYFVPTTPERGPWGRGRADTYPWPDTVIEVTPEQMSTLDIDLLVLQRPEEWELAQRWLGRRPCADLPTVYVEHNTPRGGEVPNIRHPMADRDGLALVHVTHFNALMWDSGATRHTVIEHGIPDPGHQYTGELERLGVAINEPVRRWRVTGTDLLPRFAAVAPLDVYGMGTASLAEQTVKNPPPDRGALPAHPGPPDRDASFLGDAGGPASAGTAGSGMTVTTYDDPPQAWMHAQLARHRAYLHPMRWTSLGLSLLEAMSLGMPVVALATTEAVEAVPPDAGVLSTNIDVLVDAARWLIEEPADAKRLGDRARTVAQARYGLDRFLSDWDRLLMEVSPCASQ